MRKIVINSLLLLLVLNTASPVFASSPPPSVGSAQVGSSTGVPMIAGWNYFKIVPSNCTVKQLVYELQADGGGALTVDNLWKGDANGVGFSEIDVNSDGETKNPVDTNAVYAFSANQKLFFDMTSDNCTDTPDNQRRAGDIKKIREGSKGQSSSNLLEQLLSIPQAVWQNIFHSNSTNPSSNSDALNSGNAPVNLSSDLTVLGKTSVTDLGITGTVTSGLVVLNGLSGDIHTLSGPLKFQSSATGPVDFMGGKVTIDTNGVLNVQSLSLSKDIVGTGTLPAGQNSITISSATITSSSHIFLTQKTLTTEPLAVTNVADGSFTVSIKDPQSVGINFDWLVVQSH